MLYTVLLSILLITSIIINILLYRAAQNHLNKNDIYEKWIQDFRRNVLDVYVNIKDMDQQEIFSKDDEVGIVFQDMVQIIEKLNEITQE